MIQKQIDLSERCHYVARKEIYPILFNSPSQGLEFNYKFGDDDDRNKGIDATVTVRLVQDRLPLTFKFQERFRNYDKQKIDFFNDVTFTTWNKRSDLPSEWYKFEAHFMVYGFENKSKNGFFNWAVVSIPLLQLKYMARQIIPVKQKPNNRNQEFIGFRNEDLYRTGCLVSFKNLKIEQDNEVKITSYPLSVTTLQKISLQLHEILEMGFLAHAASLLGVDGPTAGNIINKIYDCLYIIDNYQPKPPKPK
jgi:hypothetical protein